VAVFPGLLENIGLLKTKASVKFEFFVSWQDLIFEKLIERPCKMGW
jgi:hypothetical protein